MALIYVAAYLVVGFIIAFMTWIDTETAVEATWFLAVMLAWPFRLLRGIPKLCDYVWKEIVGD